jgi:hypothetical protein
MRVQWKATAVVFLVTLAFVEQVAVLTISSSCSNSSSSSSDTSRCKVVLVSTSRNSCGSISSTR